MAFTAQVATVFGEDMSGGRGGGDLDFRTQDVPRSFYRLQSRDINIRRQFAFKRIITMIAIGFSNSCP